MITTLQSRALLKPVWHYYSETIVFQLQGGKWERERERERLYVLYNMIGNIGAAAAQGSGHRYCNCNHWKSASSNSVLFPCRACPQHVGLVVIRFPARACLVVQE